MTVSDLPWQVKIVHHILILCCQGTRKIELTYLGRWNPKKRPRKAAVFAIKCVNKIHTFQKHGLFIRYGCRIDIFFEYTISNISLFFTHDRYMWHVATKHPDKNVTRCVSTNISEKPSNAGPFGPPSSPPKTWRHWWLKSDVTGWYCWWQPEIRRSPVEVGRGSLSHYLQGFFHTRRLLGISSINSMVNYPMIFRVSYILRWLFGISEPSTVPPVDFFGFHVCFFGLCWKKTASFF